MNKKYLRTDIEAAFNEAARLLREAIDIAAPFSSCDTITIDYAKWDTMCNTLAAIREKCNNWETVTPSTTLYAFNLFREISDLLKKAGY